MPGRGKSDWVPAEQYGYPLYLTVCAALLARLDVESVDWVGTSMGGLIGMLMAAQPKKSDVSSQELVELITTGRSGTRFPGHVAAAAAATV